MTGEALPAEHNVVLASSDSFASVKGAESSFTPLLVLSNSKPNALNLEGKRKERICSFHGSSQPWKRNKASFV